MLCSKSKGKINKFTLFSGNDLAIDLISIAKVFTWLINPYYWPYKVTLVKDYTKAL